MLNPPHLRRGGIFLNICNYYQGKVVSFIEALGVERKSSVYNISKVDRLMYLSTPPEEGWIHSKIIKPVWLDKPTIASVAVVSNNHSG